jgi:hypothetical protein
MDSIGHSLLAYCIREQYAIVHRDTMSLLYIKGNSSCLLSSTRRRAKNIGQFFAGLVTVYGELPKWNHEYRSPEQYTPHALNWSPFRGPIFTSCCSTCRWRPGGYPNPEERDTKVAYPLCRVCMTINRAPTIFIILTRKGIYTDIVRIILYYFLQPLAGYLQLGPHQYPNKYKDWDPIETSEIEEVMTYNRDRTIKLSPQMDPMKRELIAFCIDRSHTILAQGADSFLKFKGAASYMFMSTTSRADSLERFFAGDVKVVGRLPDWPICRFSQIERLLNVLNNRRIQFTMHCDGCRAAPVRTPLCADCNATRQIPSTLAVMKRILCEDIISVIVGFFLRAITKNNGTPTLS